MVPDAHAFAFDIFERTDDCFAVTVVEESSLFDGAIQSTWHKYALQMAIKLLVARRVMTKYYITLDADNVVVGFLDLARLLPDGKAAYSPMPMSLNVDLDYIMMNGRFAAEPRSVHPHWWQGSAKVLGLPEDAFPNAMFGVTPAILSTVGALVTTALIRARFTHLEWEQAWITSCLPCKPAIPFKLTHCLYN